MPTYSYVCNACQHEFDTIQGFHDKPLRKCPECGKLKLERLISGGGGFIFKGDGFYETDYKKAGKKSETPKETTSDSGSKSDTSSSKSDD